MPPLVKMMQKNKHAINSAPHGTSFANATIAQQIASTLYSDVSKITLVELNREVIKLWTIMQELAVYAEQSQNKEHPAYIRVANNLNLWLRQGNWEYQ